MRLEVAESLAEVSPESWNELASPSGLYASHEWLTLTEQETAGSCRYLLARENDGALAAALPVYLVHDERNPHYRPAVLFGGAAGTLEDSPTCLAGGHSAYHSQVLLNPGIAESRQQDAVNELLAGLSELATDAGCQYAFFLFHTHPSMNALRSALRRTCRPSLAWIGDATMDCAGDSFDDYLQSLKSRRRKAVREISKFQSAGLQIEIEDPWELLPVTARLIAQLQNKYNVPASAGELIESISRQYELLGDRTRLFVCRSGKAVLGAMVAYVWGDRLYVRMGGFDYPLLPGAFEYFNLVFFEPLRYCYQCGLKGVHLGAGSHEAKVLHGARVQPLSMLVLPVPGRGCDPVPGTYRDKVRSYWAEQAAQYPRAFDDGCWGEALSGW